MILPEIADLEAEARERFPDREDQQAYFLAGMFRAYYSLARGMVNDLHERAERGRRAAYDPEAVDYTGQPSGVHVRPILPVPGASTAGELVTRRERPVLLAEAV